MAKLIADIGGTGSRWAYCVPGAEPLVHTDLPGFNPSFGDGAALREALLSTVVPQGAVDLVQVYGAGCGTPERAARVEALLQTLWPRTPIQVGTDLLGAAHALCGTGSGLVLILGTGMNVGYYADGQLHTPMPSLGYILGDEGSGADIGKHLLRAHLHAAIPEELDRRIFPERPTAAAVVERLHRGEAPQAWLAGFTKRLGEHWEDPWVRELLEERFLALTELLEQYFTVKERANVHATGSVAFYFQDVLGPILTQHGMRLVEAVNDPLPGLLRRG